MPEMTRKEFYYEICFILEHEFETFEKLRVSLEALCVYCDENDISPELVMPASMFNKVLDGSRDHESKERPMNLSANCNISNRVRLQCAQCNWATNKTKRQALACHIRRAHGKAAR